MFATKEVVKDLGLRLRAARIAANLTQKELAERTGVSLSTLGNMEKGASSTSIETWITVSEYLGFLEGWSSIFAQPIDPFEDFDQRLIGRGDIAKTRVRKKNAKE